MKTILLLLTALILAPACGDHIPPLDTIEGAWYSAEPYHPEWIYTFKDGISTIATPVDTTTFIYTERQDSVYFGGDAHTGPRVWLLRFQDASHVTATRIGYPIYPIIRLQRVE